MGRVTVYLTHSTIELLSAYRDRADELKSTGEILDESEHTRQIEVRATNTGIIFDDIVTVDWDWVLAAFLLQSDDSKIQRILGERDLATLAPASSESCSESKRSP
jgi:hypothetical protein